MPMEHQIKGELGVIVSQRLEVHHHTILFPKFGYMHTLSPNTFEVVSAELTDEQLEKVVGGMSPQGFDNWRARKLNESR